MGELQSLLQSEKEKYFKDRRAYYKAMILASHDLKIWQFQKRLRKAEYYKKKDDIISKILYVVYHRRKNKLGLRLGFDIPEGCFGRGLRIYHISPVVVNPAARIGENCIIVGNVCIGNVKGKPIAPAIGDNCMFGWGSAAIGDIEIAKNCSIAAGAVVVKSVVAENETVAGIPAKRIS